MSKLLPAGPASRPSPAVVLGKAVLRAGDRLGLRRRALARVLGVSEATISRLARGAPLDPESKAGELARLFVRLFRSLDALVGGSDEAARAWFHAECEPLGGVPAERVQSAEGLVHAVEHLDALRGKL